ncbi:MAG: hypothetical protein HY547_09485 [Elusimicrobia bacterium]|nr:hypothetical protein [Elusimicrobiota bacterium]
MGTAMAALGFAAEVIRRPGVFFARIRAREIPWIFLSGLYLVSVIAVSLLYALKPQGFPQESFSADVGRHSFWFWMAMSFVGLAMTILIAGIISVLVRFLEGRSKVALTQTLAVLLATHVWYLVMALALGVAVWGRWAGVYKFFEFALSLIGFIYTVRGIRQVAGISAPKALVCLLLSSLAAVSGLFAGYLTGLLPEQMLKVLLFI